MINQKQFCVPAPKFNFGDLVQHYFSFSSVKVSFVGKVISRSCHETTPNKFTWEYEVEGDARVNQDGYFQCSEFIEEDELELYTHDVLIAA